MNATTVEPLQATYSRQIQHDPELYQALQQATVDLEELVEKHGLSPATRELKWELTGSPSSPQVTVHLCETDKYGSRQSKRTGKRSHWFDPASRLYYITFLLLDVRRDMWYAMGRSLDRLIDQMEEEEQEEREHAKPN